MNGWPGMRPRSLLPRLLELEVRVTLIRIHLISKPGYYPRVRVRRCLQVVSNECKIAFCQYYLNGILEYLSSGGAVGPDRVSKYNGLLC